MANQSFGQWFAGELRRSEMSQADFHRRSGISTGAISEWVTGKRLPEPANCDRIADVLGIPVDQVLTRAGHRPVIPARDTPEIEEVVTVMRALPSEEQEVVVEFVRYRRELARRRSGGA